MKSGYLAPENKILIGGRALIALGSSRNTQDTDYLINDTSREEMLIQDKENSVNYHNANCHKLFEEIYEAEEGKQIASPQSLLDLKAFAFVQHCLNAEWQKANDAEYDMKFLVLRFGLKDVQLAKKYMSAGEYEEVRRVIQSAKRLTMKR